MKELLGVRNLSVSFRSSHGLVHANRSVSVSLNQGETLGLVGESGCGKTVLALALLRLQQPGEITGGNVMLEGTDLLTVSEAEMQRRFRGRKLGMVPQDHGSALNPLRTIGAHLVEAIGAREGCSGIWQQLWPSRAWNGESARSEGVQALQAVGLPRTDELFSRYPHELSGGMRQRVLIALALLLQPALLICDEVTTALDASIKWQILSLLAGIKETTSMLFISHDMSGIRHLCDRVAVMYAGTIIEVASTTDLFQTPLHPYTRGLLASQRYVRGTRLVSIPGEVPDLMSFPRGCTFHLRCPSVLPVCSRDEPLERDVSGRSVACHLYES